jgi:cell wall assembly regulator SMI1
MANTIADCWQIIDGWLQKNAPQVFATLNTGSTQAEIAETEALLGIHFPQEVRESYLCHNGQHTENWALFEMGAWIPLKKIVIERQRWSDLSAASSSEDLANNVEVGKSQKVLPYYWHQQWIPLTFEGQGDSLCVDLSPDNKGTIGQLIAVYNEDWRRPVIAKSLGVYLNNLVKKLSSDEYQYSEMFECILKKIELQARESEKLRQDEAEKLAVARLQLPYIEAELLNQYENFGNDKYLIVAKTLFRHYPEREDLMRLAQHYFTLAEQHEISAKDKYIKMQFDDALKKLHQ